MKKIFLLAFLVASLQLLDSQELDEGPIYKVFQIDIRSMMF